MSRMKVLLVDDQLLFRKGLRALLESEDDMEVVSEASNGQEAIDKVKAFRPDVVLMDIHMPVCDGIQATRLLKAEHPELKVVILTVSDEDDDLFEAIKAGAEGYLLKNLRPEELTQMLRSVMANEAPVSPAIASKLLGEFRRQPRHDDTQTDGPELTSREREVLQLVAEGMSNAEIGLKLCVVEGTVKNHLHNILEKLHLQNRVQAAAYAMRAGLVSLPPRE
jgi:two-component system, NarL family, nitrate/nitrite response regulator NarL